MSQLATVYDLQLASAHMLDAVYPNTLHLARTRSINQLRDWVVYRLGARMVEVHRHDVCFFARLQAADLIG